MEYKEALKKVKEEKPKENKMVITLSYNTKLIVPYKDGATVLAALANAELLDTSYSSKKGIKEFELDTLGFQIMSNTEYERFKLAAILGVTVEQLKDMS